VTPPGTMSSADTIRDAPAIMPRASATSDAHSLALRDVALDTGTFVAGSAPSSHA
jgi:hypothetical protein